MRLGSVNQCTIQYSRHPNYIAVCVRAHVTYRVSGSNSRHSRHGFYPSELLDWAEGIPKLYVTGPCACGVGPVNIEAQQRTFGRTTDGDAGPASRKNTT